METIRSRIASAARFVHSLSPAYSFGVALLVIGAALLTTSLLSYVGIVDVIIVTGEARPGTTERSVPLDRTSFFNITLAVQSCDVTFHLLSDSEYGAFQTNGQIPPATVDCHRTDAVIRSRVGHMVTVYSAPPGAMNASYILTAAFFAERYPYALLSLPGAILAMSSTIWIASTMLHRGTGKLAADFQERQQERKRK